MGLEESLAHVTASAKDGDFSVDIKFNQLLREFDERNRMLILYSDIEYNAENFHWSSTVPTVRIPYRDPALGFLVDGVIFSSVGIYSRAPGIVPGVYKRTLKARTVEEPKIDIVNARNYNIYIGYKRNAVQIVFKRNSKDYKVPMGIFLKAFSGLPYSILLQKFVYRPQALLNSFPCEIPKGNEDLARVPLYGVESTEEPTIEECINMVYSAITQVKDTSKTSRYSIQWKSNRIASFFNNLHFKTQQKYEVTMAVGNRAVGTYLDEDICVPYFKQEKQVTQRMSPTGKMIQQEKMVETVEEFRLPKGHYVTDDDAREIRRRDIETLRVRTTRSFVLQESTLMFFRAKGYKLCNDIPEVGACAGDIIDDELLSKINNTRLGYLEVYTPAGRKVLHRSFEGVELGDFYTILNYLFTHVYTNHVDSTQYEVSNRVVLTYEKQVLMEVEQTYSDIVSSIIGSTELKNLLDAFPTLPSNRLIGYLRNSRHKEITQSDITNVMSRAISEGTASAGMGETPAAMMPVQKGQYGRMDSFHAPDSNKVGSVQHLCILARVNNDTGEIEAPYEKIVDGKPTGRIEYITAAKENNKYIAAWDCDFSTPTILVRCNGDVTTVPRERVDYRDPSPFCDMSVSRMCIPFPGFSQPKRALMATKMNGQAVPILFPERPIVSTGADTEIPALYYTGRQVLEMSAVSVVEGEKLELVGYEWKKNLVEYRFIFNGSIFTFFLPFTVTDKESLYNYNLNLKGGNYQYDLDEVVFYNHCCDLNEYDFWTRIKQGAVPLIKDHTKPAMALGVNINVCYKTFGSTTIEDALVISDRLVTDKTLSNIQIFRYNYKLKRGERFPEIGWSAQLYSHVYAGQPLINISRENSHNSLSKKQILCGQEGEVVYASKNTDVNEAEVWVSTLHSADIGDKIAGREGNKCVIAKIVPEWMMPYDPVSGITYDAIFTPLGLPSRMNMGQILEVALGAVMLKQSERGKKRVAVCTPFYPNIKNEITELYNSEGLKPVRLFNPVYGKLTDRPVMTGVMYVMKLEQMSNLKVSAVGYPQAVDPVFGQPVDSINQDKGQAVGEMESWALIASGAHHILNTLFTMYADNEASRRNYFKLLASCDESPDNPWDENFDIVDSSKTINKNALVTQTVMRMFGCDVEVVDNKYVISPLDLTDINVRVSPEEFSNNFERVKDFEWFTVELAAPVVNPFWINNFPLHLVLGLSGSVRTLAEGKTYLDVNKIRLRDECIVPANSVTEDEKLTMLTGVEAVIALIKDTTVEEAIVRLQMKYKSSSSTVDGDSKKINETIVIDNPDSEDSDESEDDDISMIGDIADVPVSVADVLRFLERMRKKGQSLSMLIWYEMPIMPRLFRQSNLVGDREHKHSFQQQLEGICSSRSTSQSIYEGLKQLIGYGKVKQEDLVSIRRYFFGRNAQSGQHGKVRGSVLSKRVGFSGRVVIVPLEDPTISPFFVGLPWRVVCVELAKVLAIRMRNRNRQIAIDISDETNLSRYVIEELGLADWEEIVASLGELNRYILGKYFVNASESDLYFIYYHLRSIVRELVEGNVRNDGMVWWRGEWHDPASLPRDATIDCAVVLNGRQPTLHKKSIRSYFVKLVEGHCQRIHPLVCAAYNADFDGDTMWNIQLLGEDKIEACETISILQDLISEKDGSYTLELSQDIALGLYCATIFKDNAWEYKAGLGDYYFFDDLTELRFHLEYGDLHYYDAVIYFNPPNGCYYCSTAGRVLLNSVLSGGFTLRPFTDDHGIYRSVVGGMPSDKFKSLLYDTVWTTTSMKPSGCKHTVKMSDIMLDVYNNDGPRVSVMAAQAFYEIGVIASDVVSVSITLDDISSDTDKQKYMEEPRKVVAQLNNLYQMGLITEDSRKLATVRVWDKAKRSAQAEIIGNLNPNSNIFLMMYSGARGKLDQVMQTVGFIGTVSKTTQADIEYPILRGYGEGLTSLDLAQLSYSARISVISTQAGIRDTGYATRQSVYMTSGYGIVEGDCGISVHSMPVEYSTDVLKVKFPDGSIKDIGALVGEFLANETEEFSLLQPELNKSGYMITDRIVDMIADFGLTSLVILGKDSNITVDIIYTISDKWRELAINSLYSYALPYTDNMKITEETVDWIESSGLHTVIAFDEYDYTNELYLDKEAYLRVDYDTSRYTIYMNGKFVDNEALYIMEVDSSTVGFKYFKTLMADGNLLTEKAVNYLTKKKIDCIKFKKGDCAYIHYSISDLFKDVVIGRVSSGLLHLDSHSCITEDTLSYVEEFQFEYIPVFTGLTCLSTGGICSKCYGKSLSAKTFMKPGDNLGIAASHAMCEPLSQATLNVAHSGGKRGSGTNLVSGLDYYTRMLKGSTTTGRTESLKERFAEFSGYIVQNPYNKSFVQIIDENKQAHTVVLDDSERLNVPSGAFVDVNDTIISGLPDLHRYDSTDIFDAALKTRYMLMQEYYKIFKSLSISARNTEILARAQTSICYLYGKGATAKNKDTGAEARNPTGQYKLMVSTQAQVVNWFTGIAGFAFENVANMILMGLFTVEGLKLNSCLGNLVTGTKVGDKHAVFPPKKGLEHGVVYHKSTVRATQEAVALSERTGDYSVLLSLGDGSGYSAETEEEILNLLGETSNSSVLPEITDGVTPELEPIEVVNVESEEPPTESVVIDDVMGFDIEVVSVSEVEDAIVVEDIGVADDTEDETDNDNIGPKHMDLK